MRIRKRNPDLKKDIRNILNEGSSTGWDIEINKNKMEFSSVGKTEITIDMLEQLHDLLKFDNFRIVTNKSGKDYITTIHVE